MIAILPDYLRERELGSLENVSPSKISSFPPAGGDRRLSCGEAVAYLFPRHPHLAKVDPVMRKLLRSVRVRLHRGPVARAIAYQQLHEKAAESILKRLIALFPGRRFPGPADILAIHWRMMNEPASHVPRLRLSKISPQGARRRCADEPCDQTPG